MFTHICFLSTIFPYDNRNVLLQLLLLLQQQSRSSHQWCFLKKVFLKNSQNSQENTSVSLFFNRTLNINVIKKRLWHRCFLVNFAKLLRTPFLQNTSGQLLLTIIAENIISGKNRKARGSRQENGCSVFF